VDSIEGLPVADSAQLVVALARLASALDSHKTSRFAGLPFVVTGARRFQADGRRFVVGLLVRRLNQEATPLEERTLIIAERPTAASQTEAYVVGYSQRSEGSEDMAQHYDMLAALRGKQAPLILVAREQLSHTVYDLLERTDDGTWRIRWSRTLAC
jgi:hypothetical protein